MADPTEINLFNQEEDPMTPKHSIPQNIHSLQISGSKGHFSSNFHFSVPSFDHVRSSYSPLTKYDKLYQDAAKRSMARDKLVSYAKAKKEREEESFRNERKLSKAESSDLFGRLNREGEKRQERLKITEKIKEDQESRQLKNPIINKSSLKLNHDVVTRLLQYGENSKRKMQEKRLKQQQIEEQELEKILSHKRVKSELTSSSQLSTPLKDPSVSLSKNVLISKNSPDKIIQKIQNMSFQKILNPKRMSSFLNN
jgi:predicted transcriptional regulator